MSGWWAVARHEVVERRPVLALALVLGAFCLLAPSFVASPAREARGLSVALGLVIFVPAVAVLAGASVLASDLISRRLGFYFSRPLGGSAIVLGKLGGALALALGAAALVAAPALVAGADLGQAIHPRWEVPAGRLAMVLAVPLLVLLAHAVAVVLRSGSRWLAADVAGAAAAVVLTARSAIRLLDLHAVEPATIGIAGVVLAAAAALLFASVSSALAGRTDPVRVHRRLSSWLWAGTLAAALAFTGYATWVIAATPRDLEWIDGAMAGPGNGWLLVEGISRRSRATYLLDTRSGRHVRLRPLDAVSFSADGRRAALLEAAGRDWPRPADLAFVRLDEARPEPVRTGQRLEPPAGLVLSADGGRVATFAAGKLAVQEVEPERSLASALLAGLPAEAMGWGWRLRMPDPDRVRLYLPGERGVEIRELDVAAHRLDTTGIAGSSGDAFLVSAAGDRLLRFASPGADGTVVTLHDGRTGARLAALAGREALATGIVASGFLADGRIVLGEWCEDVPWLRLFSGDGAALGAVALGGPVAPQDRQLWLGSEVEPGRLAVSLGGLFRSPWNPLLLVDLASGEVEELESGLWPEHSLHDEIPAAPGSLGARLFLRRAAGEEAPALVVLDPATGGLRTLVGRGAP